MLLSLSPGWRLTSSGQIIDETPVLADKPPASPSQPGPPQPVPHPPGLPGQPTPSGPPQ
jgi:hypothetical protein